MYLRVLPVAGPCVAIARTARRSISCETSLVTIHVPSSGQTYAGIVTANAAPAIGYSFERVVNDIDALHFGHVYLGFMDLLPWEGTTSAGGSEAHDVRGIDVDLADEKLAEDVLTGHADADGTRLRE
ncbi:MAG: hypothetical protein KF819_02330 [Labilithrix sp.]|nr:hypothetical protein [Labilithrix sp.]